MSEIGPAEVRAATGVVIVHYNREADLTRLLRDLTESGWDRPGQIVVVNNGGDRARVGLLAHADAVTWIDLDNPGYGAAVNVGVQALSAYERIVVATHELQFDTGALELLSSALVADETVGLCGPLLIDSRDGRVWSAGGGLSPVRGHPFHIAAGNRKRPVDAVVEATWIDGACFSFRRRDFIALGGIDERFFLYFEDVDLGLRVRSALRKRVVCLTSSVAYQSPGGHLGVYLATRNLIWVLRAHAMRLALAVVLAETLARYVIGRVMNPGRDALREAERLRGFKDGVRGRVD